MRNDLIGFTLSALAGLLLAFWLVSDVHEVDRFIIHLEAKAGLR